MFMIVYAGFLFILIVTTFVGGRLLFAAHRTRQVPELAIGFSMLAIAMGPLIRFASQRMAQPDTNLAALTLFSVGNLLSISSSVAMGLAMWKIFRANNPWARRLFWTLCALLAIDWCWITFSGPAIEGWVFSEKKFWMQLACASFPLWAVIECLRSYRMMKKRVALGFCEPLVANQVLLWGLSLSASLIVNVGESLINRFLGITLLQSSVLLLAVVGLGVGANVGMWFAFFPPSYYRAWLEPRTPHAAVEVGSPCR